jgi:hypothetical protein
MRQRQGKKARAGPFRAYHGTENTFTQFDPARGGKAMGVVTSYAFFTSSDENALYYGPLLLECELPLQKPYVVSGARARKMSPAQWARNVELMNFMRDTQYDGVILRDVLDGSHYSDVYVVFDPEVVKITGRLDYRQAA